jgi:nitrate reductase gamma subunit
MSESPSPKWQAMAIVSAVMFGVMALCGGIVLLVSWAIHK